jgi:dipeptidyl aminopeptidase/acylaminoacyl peptidase
VTLPEAERFSLRNFVGISRLHGADSLGASQYVDTIVRLAYSGNSWSQADSAARANVGKKWYMGIPDSTDAFWWLAPRIASYDPAAYWPRVRAPVLLVYGEKDERVPVEESLRRIQAALATGGNKDVTTKVFPGCDHTFRFAVTDGKFHWPRTPTDYLPTLIHWAREKTKG